jgi:hypothetical protein
MIEELSDAPVTGQEYGLLFPNLTVLDTDKTVLRRIGNLGGLADGTLVEPDEQGDAREAAGWPFFGQFVAHDITADRSALVQHANVAALRNSRRQKINLEFLYGSGPSGEPFLFDSGDPAKLLLNGHDVQRNVQGIAIIGDPRNDSHLMMSQMHWLFSTFHNRVVDWLRHTGSGPRDPNVFVRAQQLVRWHYQWIVLRDFLPRIVGTTLACELWRSGARYFDPEYNPFIPLEFAAAAYRYGHGQIREIYRINDIEAPLPLFPDLVGFGPVPPTHAVDWGYLFDLPNHALAQRCKKLDGRLTAPLMQLPEAISGSVDTNAHRALAVRDLQRGQSVGLASGETIARHLGVPPLTSEETGLAEIGWERETPLWFYVLKEAAVRENGDQLGPVGGRIVGDVLVGLIDHDPGSFRTAHAGWQPVLPSAEEGEFTMADLVAFALS